MKPEIINGNINKIYEIFRILAGGELMAYNPSSSILDFSEDMFTEMDHTSPAGTTSSLTECYNPDPLELEDSKALLVESLLSDANANKSGYS